MTEKTAYIYLVSMDVDADKEDLFNEVYDTEHVPAMAGVPGVVAATRYKVQPHSVTIGDQTKAIPDEGTPTYHAVYELESPAVMDTAAWAEATEFGRWGADVRPYTHNRRHVLMKKLD